MGICIHHGINRHQYYSDMRKLRTSEQTALYIAICLIIADILFLILN